MNRRAIAALVMVITLLAAACTASADPPFDSTLSAGSAGNTTTLDERDPDPVCESRGAAASLPELVPLPAPGAMPEGSYMADIVARGKLRAGVSQSSFKFAYLNQQGEIEGFDIEMARLVAQALLGDPNAIEFVATPSPERVPKLLGETPEVDIVVQTMTITCQRWAYVNFSSVYYQAGQKLLVRKGSEVRSIDDIPADLPVCAVRNSTSADNLTARGKTVAEVEAWTDCLRKFQQGELEAISTDDTLLAGLAAQDPLAEVVGDAISDEPYGIATPAEIGDARSAQFTGFVNGVLEQARSNGSWQSIYDTWLADSLGESTPPVAGYR